MNAKYTQSQISELQNYANSNKLLLSEAIDYCKSCHYCGNTSIDFCGEYCNERCQSYCLDFNYPCFRGNLCKVCPNGSWEPTEIYQIEPINTNSLYETQVWSITISTCKTVELFRTRKHKNGVLILNITIKEKCILENNNGFLNTRHIASVAEELHECVDCFAIITNKDLLSADERAEIELIKSVDSNDLLKYGWNYKSTFYEIDDGFTITLAN